MHHTDYKFIPVKRLDNCFPTADIHELSFFVHDVTLRWHCHVIQRHSVVFCDLAGRILLYVYDVTMTWNLHVINTTFKFLFKKKKSLVPNLLPSIINSDTLSDKGRLIMPHYYGPSSKKNIDNVAMT